MVELSYVFKYFFVGNKCVGGSVLSPAGLVVHDSHAEQLARRGFIRFVNIQKKGIEQSFEYSYFKDIYMEKLIIFKNIKNQYLKKILMMKN